ncbi:putative nucleoporin [Helianthus annuus]|uniref:Nuclear pore complex protein Nup85 n=1 Tax=Helianthus annuus TaxID=4232 RepID=A0A251SRG1_HELAN|nr:nuclear pore complex protein NUP85 isoform X2 [Helianthus annuus]KAF5773318.1 putative nucleoporin Nup85 [Helianthus annuus]KAJ0476826.1 putative nucleoporin [Helianthus annuus]KAJ0497650.1 putative nucleoporin [Helianthus annuus]KAJ0663655.1 putative nucleoporin [Helianthus annuus]KAJ0671153.1 putative nucleoporin [Helianthus annuus]
MPGLLTNSGDSSSIVPYSPTTTTPTVYTLHHGLTSPITPRLSISWSRGNSLRVTVFRSPEPASNSGDDEAGGKVVDLKLSGEDIDSEISDAARWRRIAYGSVAPFAHLQNKKNAMAALAELRHSVSYDGEWSKYVLEYSKQINSLLGSKKSSPPSLIEDPKTVLKVEEPNSLKAAWELLEIFYADKQSHPWIPEQLVDWLSDYDALFSGQVPSVHLRLVEFQAELINMQAVENEPAYWQAISSALAVGWLDIVVKLLRLHGSYQLHQLGARETENGLVEAVAVLVSKMPRMRVDLPSGKLGECYNNKSDFMRAWEKWRAQITKLDCSAFWLQCSHNQTKENLKNLLQILLGNTSTLSSATCHWVELYIAHFLYIRPFTSGLESMYVLAQKCIQLKPVSTHHKLMRLILGILEENTEVVLAECSRSFGPWMIAHATELLTAGSVEAEILLKEERDNLGGISIEESHRLVYAQVLSSHALTWQIAPIYLISCVKHGVGLLEILLYKQPAYHSQVLLKNIEICRMYDLDSVSSNAMKIAGVHHWKHGRKGAGVFWLQQAGDETRLNRIAQKLFDFVGKSISDESFEQWEGLIELLGSESRTAGGLEFLHKYRDFKKSLQQVQDGVSIDAARKAVEALISLMKNPSTPQRFWLPLMYDSLKLLNWQERPLLNVSQTNLLLNKLQELLVARLRPDFVEVALPPEASSSVRVALATNLGRAILEE